jgi:arginine decarboxylase
LPRDAFFARTEQVPTDRAVGRIAAEVLTLRPPGIPAAVPGERFARHLGDLRSGVQAGWSIPTQLVPPSAGVHVMTE